MKYKRICEQGLTNRPEVYLVIQDVVICIGEAISILEMNKDRACDLSDKGRKA